MRTPYVRYSRVPIAMWYPLMRVQALPSVCESPGKTRPTCQYDESIRVHDMHELKEHCLYTDHTHISYSSIFVLLSFFIQKHRAETAEAATVFKVSRKARLIGTGTTSVKASEALKRMRGQIRFKGPGYIRRRPGACIIWGLLGTANE
ncbi:hypothetical protein ALC62_01270 [Cyphomyrmex costatus]|uniref:Uncharacterized protein n=1 Tax=Cyphomyrmex costatus TaxID=456900 RepID=A0A195D5P7_9HYME|nr:hypothetical protein ALC62_01270 [Cyphomyrmex costatus]